MSSDVELKLQLEMFVSYFETRKTSPLDEKKIVSSRP